VALALSETEGFRDADLAVKISTLATDYRLYEGSTI
jgi:hypothetical protein